MTTYLLKITHVRANEFDPVSTWHQVRNTDWPTAPRVGDFVQLSENPDHPPGEVDAVDFMIDGSVRLSLGLSEEEDGITHEMLESMAFHRQDRQEPPRDWFPQ